MKSVLCNMMPALWVLACPLIAAADITIEATTGDAHLFPIHPSPISVSASLSLKDRHLTFGEIGRGWRSIRRPRAGGYAGWKGTGAGERTPVGLAQAAVGEGQRR